MYGGSGGTYYPPNQGGGGGTITGTGGNTTGTGGTTVGAAGATTGTGGMTAGAGGMTAGAGGMTAGAGGMMAGAGGSIAPVDGGLLPTDGSTTDAIADAVVDATDSATEPGDTCLQGTGDFTASGPYQVQTKQVTIGSSGAYTIYYPNPLESNCPHPIVAWGNGTTVTGGTAYDHFNEHMASWGIVAIASHDSNVGDGSFHRAAIDYLLAENLDPSSEFYGKLSDRAGVTGHSQGGAGGDRASTHPNVQANGNVQGSFGTPPGGDVAFLCLTGTEDLATQGCLDAVNAIATPALYASYDGMSHIATMSGTSPGSQQYARLLSAWFRCFLADDSAACAMFQGGASCPVCLEPGWDNIFANNY